MTTTAADGGSGTRQRKRIAVYGGAYDPITTAHLQCAAQIIHSREADEVLVVPCGPRPDKPSLTTSSLDRYVMCQMAVNTTFTPDFPIAVSQAEVGLEKAMATYDLLTMLRDENPDTDIVFVLGSDWLQSGTGNDIRNWRSNDGPTGKRLVDEFDFLVVKRPGYEVEDLRVYSERFRWLVMPDGMQYIDSNLSSTEIRSRAYSSVEADRLQIIDGLVAPGVLAFVKRQGLYLSDQNGRGDH
eukprot:Rhum_TRINITY_DN12725_c0_g1::Rhum_TRINITY_DN12725_c0_g1_i1::g.53990::m.53990/K00969/nadD; nicotinate-nucleotide adenylyltransferase